LVILLLTLNQEMRDQEKQLGALLKKLRKQAGYSIEDWAAIFNTEPTIIASIELGQELPQEFLIALIEWIITSLEHPQNTTQILPTGWQRKLPKAVNTVLGSIELKNSKLRQLEQALRLQEQIIERTKNNVKAHANQVKSYEKLLDTYRAKINDLEKKQVIDQKLSRYERISRILPTMLLLLCGVGALFILMPQVFPGEVTPKPALSLQKRIVHQQVPLIRKRQIFTKMPQKKESNNTSPVQALASKRRRRIKTLPPLSEKIVAKNTPQPKNKVISGANQDLSDLLALNGERKKKLHEQYISNQGKTILKFNNIHKKKMVLVINDSNQKEIYRDTIRSREYLLDIGSYLPGKYYYWMHNFPNSDSGRDGTFVVKAKK